MAAPFKIHSENDAPEASKALLKMAQQNMGMLPNLERVMAGAPTLLQAYVTLWELFDHASLSPIERQIVYQAANIENHCQYCVPWHTQLSIDAGMDEDDINALRNNAALSTTKYAALHRFAQQLIQNNGHVSEEELDAFLEVGYAEQQAMEVILGLAIKLMSNYTNAIAKTPLDEEVMRHAWDKPLK